jgi:hypothetical protein
MIDSTIGHGVIFLGKRSGTGKGSVFGINGVGVSWLEFKWYVNAPWNAN